LSNGLEAAARVRVMNIAFDEDRDILLGPYLHAGVGWKHYSIEDAAFNTSSLRENDDVVEVPVGVGLSWNFGRIIADQRLSFRPAFDNDLFADPTGGDDADLGTWNLSARVGVEF